MTVSQRFSLSTFASKLGFALPSQLVFIEEHYPFRKHSLLQRPASAEQWTWAVMEIGSGEDSNWIMFLRREKNLEGFSIAFALFKASSACVFCRGHSKRDIRIGIY